MKMNGSVPEEKSSFTMLGLSFSSKLDWGSCILSIAKTASMKIGVLIWSMTVLPRKVSVCLYNLPYCLAWNTVVMCGLLLLTATWIC